MIDVVRIFFIIATNGRSWNFLLTWLYKLLLLLVSYGFVIELAGIHLASQIIVLGFEIVFINLLVARILILVTRVDFLLHLLQLLWLWHLLICLHQSWPLRILNTIL